MFRGARMAARSTNLQREVCTLCAPCTLSAALGPAAPARGCASWHCVACCLAPATANAARGRPSCCSPMAAPLMAAAEPAEEVLLWPEEVVARLVAEERSRSLAWLAEV